MNTDRNVHKITLVLYLGVLFILIGFYFAYKSSNLLQQDIKNMNKLYVVSSLLSTENSEQTLKTIDNTLVKLYPWTKKDTQSQFYISSQSLDSEFTQFVSCWESYKQKKVSKEQCMKMLHSLIFSVNHMIILKQNRFNNILYINFAMGLALFVILIFLIRAYIYQQLHKKALLDVTTKLYSKDYLLATMKELVSRQKRMKEDLSGLYIEIENSNIEENLKKVAEVLLSIIRESDIACRYNENGFVVILPHTDKESVDKIISRLHKKLTNIKYKCNVVQYDGKEHYKSFIDLLVLERKN